MLTGKYLLAAAIAATVWLWASAFVAIRAGITDYSPQHLSLIRGLTSSLVYGVVAMFAHVRIPAWRDLLVIFFSGLFGFAGYSLLLSRGEMSITASSASFIVNTVPIITVVLSILLFKEKLSRSIMASMVIGFTGISIITLGESESVRLLNLGTVFVFVAAIFQSSYFLLQKILLKKYSPVEAAAYTVWVGTLMLLIFAPGLKESILSASAKSTYAILYLGIFPGALGYLVFTYILSIISASSATQFLYLVPVVSIIVSYFWLSEIPSPVSIVGGVVALSAIIPMAKTLGR